MALKEKAAEVLELIKAGRYVADGQTVRFAREQSEAVERTRLYTPDDLANLTSGQGLSPSVKVVDGTTQAIAQQMAETSPADVAVLNFASARNPGGGFLNGAKAQEEDLCRCSGLYPCLLQCMPYYEANRRESSLLYTDHAIFSPRVPFFKLHGTGELLAEPFFVSVITMPAPNSGPFLREEPGEIRKLEATFLKRWSYVLRIAHDQGITRLLLGAWGCGAFGGDPDMASRTAQEAIADEGRGLSEIVFAIPGNGKRSLSNLKSFQATLRS